LELEVNSHEILEVMIILFVSTPSSVLLETRVDLSFVLK